MTRAKRRLFLTHAEARRMHGADFSPAASRFIREVPAELIEEVRLRANVSRPVFRRTPPRAGIGQEAPGNGALRLGQRVEHPKFGEGVVLMYEGQGSHARVQVNFANAGAKWLVVAYANLRTA